MSTPAPSSESSPSALADAVPRRRITRVLVANRGEIALRVMRTCREMGIETVAVYSEADRGAPHVRFADAAYEIGPAPSAQSYLVAERLLDVLARSGADAGHPGYGFLSENAAFAEAVEAAGAAWIGPPPHAMRVMGDKTAARAKMAEAGVPMAPGTTDAVTSIDDLRAAAADIGYPVLLKAAAGGGGKGMRVVEREADLASSFEMAAREATNAFGDGRVFVERFVTEPRHIEIQVLGDQHGTILHLHERECSIQRRHQKVIEEAPSALLTPEIRAEMGAAAVAAARTVGYFSAGTVEFLVETVDGAPTFYFMEMNTRLQVEHPVTEMITGVDLVREMIRVAEGEPLAFAQADVAMNGHAIECRVYAESAARGFLPDPGPLIRHAAPSGPGVRVDAGVEEGGEVPVYYDPMISKLSAWAPTRAEAIARMDRALGEYAIAGVETTIPFCRFVMRHESFRAGTFSTRFVERYVTPEALDAVDEATAAAAALAAVLLASETATLRTGPSAAPGALVSRWARRRERR